MFFKYLVVSIGGIPIFEYPSSSSEKNLIYLDPILFSGLMSAINSYSLETTGHIINELSFGEIQATFSKDEGNNLHVLLTPKQISSELQKELHIEIKSLFLEFVRSQKLSIKNNDETGGLSLKNMEIDESLIRPIFEPFYKSWSKRIEKII